MIPDWRNLQRTNLHFDIDFTLLEIAEVVEQATPDDIALLISFLANRADHPRVWKMIDILAEDYHAGREE